jgi:tetratricopeptide (TPR) repeat protein
MFHKWGTKPYWGAFYYELGICYHRTGQYKKEKKLYKKADRDFPDDPELMDQHAWLALTLGDTVTANRYIEKWILVRKEESWSDAQIASYLAYVYDMAGIPEKTEECLRKALSLEPENPARMSSLANFLIDKDRNVEEGLELAEKALEMKPDNYNFLHNKGWGFYKQGKYAEAVEFLQKSWDLRMQNSIYNHKAFQYLEKAKTAAAGQG